MSTEELIKLWLRARSITDSSEIMYRMLYRHLREIQYSEPITRFGNLGYEPKDKVSQGSIEEVFAGLNLTSEEGKLVKDIVGDVIVEKFSEMLKNEGKAKSKREFKKMEKNDFERLN